MNLKTELIISFAISVLCVGVQCENILFLYPNASPSHKNPAIPIITGLAERGHKITVVSSFKTETHPNIRDFHPFKDFDYFPPEVNVLKLRQSGIWGMIFMDYEPIFRYCHELYRNYEFKELVRTQKFDLILMDAFANECLLGLVHRLGAPFMYVSAMPIPGHTSPFLGARFPPSFVPHFLTRFSDRMTFPQRVANMLYSLMGYYGFRRPFSGHEEIYRRYMGDDVPGVDHILGNMSMLLSNEHFSLNFPRPNLPDLVDIGAIHCRKGRVLPKVLRDFLNGAENGVIVFSLGSIVRPHEMTLEMRTAFVNVFSRLKQRILWKWPEEIPGLPVNVMLSAWIPQQDVLAHPNTRLFITHAGLLSTQEAIYHGVPMVDIPIFGDQDFNAHRATELGIAVTLEILDINEEALENAIYTVLNDSRYTERVNQMAEYIHDQPETPKERALFWVEYVLRHKGARYLRSAARDLNFFQYYCLDVVAVLLTAVSAVVFISFVVLKKLVGTLIRCFLTRVLSKKKLQ